MNKEYRKFAIKLAKKAGKIIRDNFSLDIDAEWKDADEGPVTKIDLEVNQLLLKIIKKEFPEHGIISEEGSDCQGDEEYKWVCDPIDGTVPFSHGVATSVFSIALVKDGQPILGVVYDPFLKRMFVAEKNHGTYLNGKRIRVSDMKVIKNSVVHDTPWNSELFKDVKNFRDNALSKSAFYISIGSGVHGGIMVAAGKFIAATCTSPYAHDAASVKIIVEEAGGKVTDLNGNEQRYDQRIKGFVATNGYLHDEIIKLMRQEIRSKN